MSNPSNNPHSHNSSDANRSNNKPKPSKGLGKGFESLIPTNFDLSLLVDSKDRIQKLFITSIQPNADQPRRHFDEAALQELAISIKQFGILQPLIVQPVKSNLGLLEYTDKAKHLDTDTGTDKAKHLDTDTGTGTEKPKHTDTEADTDTDTQAQYQIIAGERRWRAAQIANLQQVPVIVRQPAELEELEIALIENVQRVDLSPLEQAVSIEKLHQQFNLTYQEIAERLGKAVTTLNNIVRLLRLPPAAHIALQNNEISEGHARAILSLKDQPTKQTELLNFIIKNGWSVRQAEQYVVAHKSGAQTPTEAKQRMATETPATKKLAEQLHAKVSLKHTARGGRLEIHFKTATELDQLLNRFGML